MWKLLNLTVWHQKRWLKIWRIGKMLAREEMTLEGFWKKIGISIAELVRCDICWKIWDPFWQALNPYWQIVENSFRNFSEIFIFRVVTQAILLENSSIPIATYHIPYIIYMIYDICRVSTRRRRVFKINVMIIGKMSKLVGLLIVTL